MTDTTMSTPDTNKNGRRLMNSSNNDDDDENTTDSTSSSTRLFLEQQLCGLDPSTPIDPVSLQALREIITTPKHENRIRKKLNKDEMKDNDDDEKPAVLPPPLMTESPKQQKAPVSTIRPAAMLRVSSDLTQTGGGGVRGMNNNNNSSSMDLDADEDDDAATDASVAGSVVQVQTTTPTPTERIILDQLKAQTTLLLDMQRRLDELHEQVMMQQQQQNNGGTTRRTAAAATTERVNIIRRDMRIAGQPPPPPAAAVEATDVPRNNVAPAVQPNENNDDDDMILLARLYHSITSLPTTLRNSRIAKIVHLFFALQRRQVHANLDGGFIIKLVIMVALIMAKLNNNSKHKRNKKSEKFRILQFYTATFLILLGFLIQSGYGKFIYNFFVKEKYHERIWNGQDITPENVGNIGNAQANNNNGGGGGGARQQQQQPARQPQPQPRQRNLFQGAIPPLNQQRGANNNNNVGIADAIWDFVYLLLSFVLSIFPMWKIEGPPPPAQAQARVEQQEQAAAAIVNQQQQQGGEPDDEPDLVDEQVGDEREEEEDEIYRDD